MILTAFQPLPELPETALLLAQAAWGRLAASKAEELADETEERDAAAQMELPARTALRLRLEPIFFRQKYLPAL